MPMGLGMPRTFLVLPVPASDPQRRRISSSTWLCPKARRVCVNARFTVRAVRDTIPARENTKFLSRDWTTGESKMMT